MTTTREFSLLISRLKVKCRPDQPLMKFFSPFCVQDAGTRAAEAVQKDAATDRLHGVSVGTADLRVFTPEPHW